jgi:rhomboid protease GluP
MDDAATTRQEGIAAYIAKALIAKKGYRPGTVAEARLLLEHCDAVLTRADGLTISIIGILDRDENPDRRFSLTKADLDSIGTACLTYSGKAGFRKLPVSITIIEAGAGPAPEDAVESLKPIRSSSPFARVHISAFSLSAEKQELWTNTPLRGRVMASFLKGLMSKPRLRDEELAPKPPAAMAEHRPLTLTYGLLALLVAVFAAEYVFRVGPESGFLDPGIKTLIALGALDKSAVLDDGEWWRLFTAPLLHGGLVHIALNGLALFFAGAVLENVIGRAWFAAIFAVTAVAGAAMSLFVNSSSLISVGASGAIMGLFAAAFSVSYRYPVASPMRTFLQSGSLRVLIPSLIPLFDGLFGQRIDFAAHMGGAIGGVLIGALLVAIWRREESLPPYRGLALGLAVAGLCGALYGGTQAAEGYNRFDLSAQLIPSQQVPKDFGVGKANSASLVASYPRDPRSHMYRALALMEADDNKGAEREWRAALGDPGMLRLFFNPELEHFIRANLAGTLKENGKQAEALETAKPLCAVTGTFQQALAKEGLCP